MRISDDGRLCSVFVGFGDPNDPASLSRIEGTAFVVGHDRAAHLVTAGHVARNLSGAPFAVRLTGPDGLALIFDVEHPEWRRHPDPTVDLAVMLIDLPIWAKTTALPSDEFVDLKRLTDWEIGPGDAAYVVGLFNLHSGKRKNLPVVHAGHIALMPSDERIPVNFGDKTKPKIIEIEAYLVEAQALPGASGSPVVVRPTIRFTATHSPEGPSVWDKQPRIVESLAIAESRDFLLGVWVAAWPGPPDETMRNALGLPKGSWVPVGMGIVVPAARILEILVGPDLTEDRRLMREKELSERAARPTAASTPKSQPIENPDHRENFNSLLTSAAKRHPPADQT